MHSPTTHTKLVHCNLPKNVGLGVINFKKCCNCL